MSHHWPFLHVRKEPLSTSAIGWIALTITIVSGSTFNGFAKVLTTALSPLSLLLLSEIIILLSVVLTFGLLPTAKRVLEIDQKHYGPLLAMGVCSGLGGPILWFSGLEYTEAVNASFFGKTEIVFLIILAHFLLREKFSRNHLLASLAIMAGVLTITFHGFTTGLQLQIGDLLILCAAFSYSLGNMIYRRFLTDVPPEVALLVRSSTAIVTFFLISPFIPHPLIAEIIEFPLTLVPAVIGFGFLSRFLNSFSFYEAIAHLPVSTVSLFGALEVVGGVLFAFFYIGESVEWYHFLGGTFIFGGALLLEFAGSIHSKGQDVLPAVENTQP